MITISIEKFLSLKFSDEVSVICDACGNHYTKTKRQLYQNNKNIITEDGYSNKISCSKKCQNIIQQKTITVYCKHCKKKFNSLPHKSSIYCSHKCSNSDRIKSEESKEKTRQTIIQYYMNHPNPVKYKKCIICKKLFSMKKRITCSNQCKKEAYFRAGKNGGMASASKMIKRSKAEIELYNLLSSVYYCDANKPMFNGWDADIIIPKIKLAILWNGPWHYTKIKKTHSLSQVQTRDKIKLNEINNCGYNYIVVKDFKNKMTPKKAFNRIMNCIVNDNYNLSIF